MSIYKSSVMKPITTIMVFVAVIVMGLYSLTKLPIDLYPEMEFPTISVMTSYPGASAADIETNVTKRIEDAVSSVSDLKEVTSKSMDNLSVVTLEFEWGANLDEAVNDVRGVLDGVYDDMPDGAERPTIFKFNMSMMPILFYAVTAEESYPGLEKILDEKLINPLNRIDGIGSVSLMGTPKRVVYVDVDPSKLDAYNLTIEGIGNVIKSENLNLPSGNVKMGKDDYQLRVEGEFSESSQIKNLVLGSFGGKNIYMGDVAQVRDTIKDVSVDEKINSRPGLRLMITKQSGGNTVTVAREVKAKIAELQKTLPPDVKIDPIFDSSDFIKGAVNNLSETLMYALFFVVLVVLFFLGRWRATFIIALTIPVSLIVSFIYLAMTGNSINIISLSSLSIAIGMVVDDAIVVLENITKHIERGASPREAAIYATNEVWLSVIVTTAVVVAVFLPLTMVSGLTGVMFKQLGWIVTITVVVSTFAAITLTPMLASKLMSYRKKNSVSGKWSFDNTIGKWLDKLDNVYEKALRWSLHHKKVVVFSSLGIFIISLGLGKFMGTDFMPENDESRITLVAELQSGIRVEESAQIARKIEKILRDKFPEVRLISASSGSDDDNPFTSLFGKTGSNIINMTISLKPVDERERSIWDIQNALRPELKNFPEIISYNFSSSNGMMGSSTIDVEVYGYNFDQTNKFVEEFRERVAKLKGAEDIEVTRNDDRPELKINFDREKLARYGLNSATVSAMVRNRVAGLTASKYREEGDEFDIIVRLPERSRSSISDIENITLVNARGEKIKLRELGEVKEYWSPPNIEHKRKERIVTIKVKPVGVPMGELAANIKQELQKVQIPQEIMVNVGGAYEDQQDSFMDLALLMLLSLLLVYIVMASQFESFSNPFVIMFAIPFAFSGSIFALLLTGTTLNMIGALGMVLLIGIVVKNGIVLVDFINLMRDRGLDLYEAIAVSGKSRLRPVVMTSMTTILGMLPMALSTGEGSETWTPMGITVIGGLTFSTFVTLIIVPVMYAVMARRGERNKQSKLRKGFEFMEDKSSIRLIPENAEVVKKEIVKN